MIKEIFIGKPLSHFQMNPLVKAFIVSETFLWSSWNSVTPVFAIFAANHINGSNTEIAASSFSVYMVGRVIFELISGRYLLKGKEFKKYLFTIMGIFYVSIAYLGFAFSHTIFQLYLFSFIAGIGLGVATPAKNSLFSSHLDKKRESIEWGIYDAIVFMGMALSGVVGGFIANRYSFQLLFVIASVINLFSTLPYFLYIKRTS